jgi:hypothetical protein
VEQPLLSFVSLLLCARSSLLERSLHPSTTKKKMGAQKKFLGGFNNNPTKKVAVKVGICESRLLGCFH